ncbi:hypothetical protein SNE40_004743 [Patella caerulea]|uniref:Coiled-coil-helix-coiled-coil-helix domain-containing protein 7 n=1 Tax=Patella caerulea TaxID=87958 RepID=A0AAN8K3J8_PATCE
MSELDERVLSPKEIREKKILATRQNSHEKNTCLREQEASLKCMHDSGYDRDACSKYFQNYRNCRDFWNHVIKDRRRNGIKPYLPPVSERPALRKQYKDFMPWLPD